MTERLNFETVLKSALSGSEFHTLTTRPLKKAALTRDTLRFLYSLYWCPSEGRILNLNNHIIFLFSFYCMTFIIGQKQNK